MHDTMQEYIHNNYYYFSNIEREGYAILIFIAGREGERQREGGRENSRERARKERSTHLSIFTVLSQWSDMGSSAMVFHFLLAPPLILGGTSCHYQ